MLWAYSCTNSNHYIAVRTGTYKFRVLEDPPKLAEHLPVDFRLYHSRVKGHNTGKQRTGFLDLQALQWLCHITKLGAAHRFRSPCSQWRCRCLKLQQPGRRDSKHWCRLRKLRKALHTAMRLHRHNKLQSMKLPGAASANQAPCNLCCTTQDPIKSLTQNELQIKIDALMSSARIDFQHCLWKQIKMHGQIGRRSV